ncbi:hypothetical protein BD779DRAFT_1783549, partial [Infundibulicybe gibba]
MSRGMNTILSAACVGLVFSTLEFLTTLTDEARYIWRRPVTLPRCLFICSRYVGLACHIANVIIANHILGNIAVVPAHICLSWLKYQIVIIYFLLAIVDLILVIRVHALYQPNRFVGPLLLLVIITRIGLVSAGTTAALPLLDFTSRCLMTNSPRNMVTYFACGEIGIQLLIFGLTFSKYRTTRAGWGRTPLVSALNRDGALVLMALSVVLITAAVNSRSRDTDELQHMVFPIFVSILSSTGYRLIINTQRLAITSWRPSVDAADEFSTVYYDSFCPAGSSSLMYPSGSITRASERGRRKSADV